MSILLVSNQTCDYQLRNNSLGCMHGKMIFEISLAPRSLMMWYFILMFCLLCTWVMLQLSTGSMTCLAVCLEHLRTSWPLFSSSEVGHIGELDQLESLIVVFASRRFLRPSRCEYWLNYFLGRLFSWLMLLFFITRVQILTIWTQSVLWKCIDIKFEQLLVSSANGDGVNVTWTT